LPALAERFTVVTPDPRGVGASDKSATGYDAAALADGMAALMTAQQAIDVYVDQLRDPAALHASFEYYRTLDNGDRGGPGPGGAGRPRGTGADRRTPRRVAAASR
jgi:hypothetical protein